MENAECLYLSDIGGYDNEQAAEIGAVKTSFLHNQYWLCGLALKCKDQTSCPGYKPQIKTSAVRESKPQQLVG